MGLKDNVVVRLREAIVRGEYRGGERLKEIELCRRFNVSRTPVREALKELEQECLVEITAHQGARVKELTVEDIYNIYDVLIMVEGVASRLACSKITSEQVQRLEEYQFMIERAAATKNYDLVHQLNHQFHRTIAESSGNPYVLQIWNNFRHLSILLGRYTLSPMIPDQLQQTLLQHPEIIEAIKAKNAALAEFVARRHLETGRGLLLQYVQKLREQHRIRGE
ncbi:MAG: GntR family transcriptional regulator [Deltaproteobacteria bacterium]|nr:GntR family transcriptional regulator [Deltaproteobacteria bacterium]MBW2016927.1 GntR family transcriptional regulator [Deltaproteobacteria bacterium]MBW2129391.1 GntR family transcriptional regulator [Deltaproteobacteria bacterium]MBW2303733.1 GntR family transcriptional regulator [Deltaproteobacteria bacterium]